MKSVDIILRYVVNKPESKNHGIRSWNEEKIKESRMNLLPTFLFSSNHVAFWEKLSYSNFNEKLINWWLYLQKLRMDNDDKFLKSDKFLKFFHLIGWKFTKMDRTLIVYNNGLKCLSWIQYDRSIFHPFWWFKTNTKRFFQKNFCKWIYFISFPYFSKFVLIFYKWFYISTVLLCYILYVPYNLMTIYQFSRI